ncbi:MAG: acyltransferase [Bacteriovorax sp.]
MKLLEILWGIMALVIYKLALWPVLLIVEHVPLAHTSWWISFFIPPAICLFIFNLLLIMALLHRCVPLPKEGEYEMQRRGEVLKWMYHAGVQNLARILGISKFILAYPLLRRLYFFASKSKVSSSAIISYDVKLVDPFMLEIEEGAKLGEWCKMAAHYSQGDKFFIKKIVIKKNAVIGGDSLIGAGVIVGENAKISARSFLLPDSIVGANEEWMGHPAKRKK